MGLRLDPGILWRRLASAALCLGAAAGVCLLACALLWLNPGFMQRLNGMAYDAWMKALPKPAPHPGIAIIDIDEKSLDELGQWPWPRYILADLVNRLLDSGAAAIGLDLLLREPDRSSPAWFSENLAARFGKRPDLGGIPDDALDNDILFRDAIAGRPVVLGAFTQLDGPDALPRKLPPPTGLAERTPRGAPDPRAMLPKAHGLLEPLPLFSDAAPIGIINASFHSDGIVRSVPMLVAARGNVYAGLAARALMSALGGKTLRLDSDSEGLASLQIGKLKAPVGADGSFRPIFRGPGRTYPYLSAADIISGRIPAQELAARILFIGSSSTGLRDIRATPFDPVMPGVEMHATVADNILSGEGVVIPVWNTEIQILAIALASLLASILFGRFSALAYAPAAVIMIGGCFWASWAWFQRGVFISPAYAVLAILLSGMILLPARFWQAERARRRIKSAFGRYVSPEVVSRIAAGSSRILGGERKEISILFTDVRGFTTISEGLSPDRLVALLNSYFTPMTACVKSREGTLDKFIGDALMAFWNAPVDVKDHQLKAVEAALEMQRRLAGMRAHFRDNFNVSMRIGAGIHCGEARVGNMGSDDLLNYTCIGDNVNLASRLEGLCKRYGAGIIVSGAVRSACGGALRFRQLDRVSVKGSHRALEIFSPLDPEAGIDDNAESAWRESLEAYFARDFAGALPGFSSLAGTPGFAIAARLFAGRCESLMRKPMEDWSGVWAYDTK